MGFELNQISNRYNCVATRSLLKLGKLMEENGYVKKLPIRL